MKIIGDFSHWPARGAVALVEAKPQIMFERFGIPAHRRRRGFVQGIGRPALRFAPRQSAIGFFGSQKIAWRVTGAAMAEPFDEISAAIEGLVVRGVGAERASAEEKQIPAEDERPDV